MPPKPLYLWASADGASGDPLGSTVTLDVNDRVRDSSDVLYNYLSQGTEGLHTTNGSVIKADYSTGTEYFSDEAWNKVKTFGLISAPSSLNNGSVSTTNFAHSIIWVQRDGYELTTDAVNVTVDGSKRGEVLTGNGNDQVEWGTFSNGNIKPPAYSEAINIATNGGDDSVVFRAATPGSYNPTWQLGPQQYTDGHTAVVTVDLGAGADTYTGAGLFATATIKGGQNNDVITGGEGAETVYGGKDADLIFGNGGTDLLNGNTGMDTVYGGAGTDTVHGGSGDDVVAGGTDSGTAEVTSNDGVTIASAGWTAGDEVYGDLGSDTVVFGDGDGVDIVKTFTLGADTLVINTVYDLLFLQVGSDTLIGFYDTVAGAAVANQLLVIEGALLDSGDISFPA